MFENVNGARLAAKRIQDRYGLKASLAAEIVARAAGWSNWHDLEKGVGKALRPIAPHGSYDAFVTQRLPDVMPSIMLMDIEPLQERERVTNYSYPDLLALIADTNVRRPSDEVISRNAHLVVMSCGIIDWWQGMVPIRRIDPEDLANGDYFEEPNEHNTPLYVRTFRTEIYEMLLVGRWLASHVYFEGDMRVGPYLCSTPDFDGIEVPATNMLGWKQSNNGSSFVVMDSRMPHITDPTEIPYSMTLFAWSIGGLVQTGARPPY